VTAGQARARRLRAVLSRVLSNSRTATLVDFSDDNAFGARVLLSHLGELQANLGGSFFWGTSSDFSKSVRIHGLGTICR
jgi:hypothetical protein